MNTIKENLAVVKNELKVEAKELATLKIEIKEKQKSGGYAGSMQCDLIDKRHEWRHKFIAYCTLKGRTIDEIESNCHEDNQPDLRLVELYREQFSRVGDDNA